MNKDTRITPTTSVINLAFCVVIASVSLASSARADSNLLIVNQSNEAINEVYVASPSTNAWATDLLGNDILEPKAIFSARLQSLPYCAVDVKVVYASGRSDIKRRINACTTERVVFGSQSSDLQSPNPFDVRPPVLK